MVLNEVVKNRCILMGPPTHFSLYKAVPVFLFVCYKLNMTYFCHSNKPTQPANALYRQKKASISPECADIKITILSEIKMYLLSRYGGRYFPFSTMKSNLCRVLRSDLFWKMQMCVFVHQTQCSHRVICPNGHSHYPWQHFSTSKQGLTMRAATISQSTEN